uniref:PDZ domain-containing protein n=1 Tax=Tetradesmus obliquus TaxID=3088 RepID=A0A383WG76_TETOB|eukprot:jgi/Sobl393_1/19347/SZX76069.1
MCSVDIPTAEARSCLRFQAVPSGTGQAIMVSAVAEGSSPEEAGVRRGMKLVGISDPIREYEVWDLQDRPSLRYVRDVLRMRSSNSITLRFLEVAELLQALEAADGIISLTTTNNNSSSSNDGSSTPISGSTPLSSIDSISSLASISDSDGSTIAERLQQQYEQAQQGSSSKPLTGVEQREQRRKSYMEQVGQRNDSGFLAVLAASFLLPALVILAVAYSTGYLDSMYSNSLYTAR